MFLGYHTNTVSFLGAYFVYNNIQIETRKLNLLTEIWTRARGIRHTDKTKFIDSEMHESQRHRQTDRQEVA